MSSAAPFLPIEIIADVLKRLPVKSLIRFQTVCKLWKNLIKSPSFIASHLDHSDRVNLSLISRGRHTTVSGTSILYFLDRDMQLRRFQNNPFIDSLKHASIVGSSNGLLCVLTGLPGTLLSIYVCNPAIREVIEVPRSPSMDLPYIPFLGFAFSPTVNDYKIVIPYVPRGNHKYAFEAYSVTTNSWKNIGMGSLKVTSHPFGCITFNGSMFWFTSQRGLASHECTEVILSLCLAMDEFTLIPLPPLSRKDEIVKLTAYKNRLAVFHCSRCLNRENILIDLWVIEEGIGFSWSKILTCGPYGPYPGIVAPLTIWMNQIVCDVFVTSQEGNTYKIDGAGSFLFDPTSNEVKVLYSGRDGILDSVFTYSESLVPISIDFKV